MEPIVSVAAKAGIPEDYLECYGKYKAKISAAYDAELKDRPDGRLILVTAVNPTPAGEGKTTVTIGLTQALQKMGKNAITCLREPSLGPCMGVKGGAAGGGRSPFWRQMLSDMYGCPVSTVQSDQGGALGAAILAGVGAGIYSDLETACAELVRKKDVSQPDMGANGEYAKYFGLYKGLYRTLFDSFKELRDI